MVRTVQYTSNVRGSVLSHISTVFRAVNNRPAAAGTVVVVRGKKRVIPPPPQLLVAQMSFLFVVLLETCASIARTPRWFFSVEYLLTCVMRNPFYSAAGAQGRAACLAGSDTGNPQLKCIHDRRNGEARFGLR